MRTLDDTLPHTLARLEITDTPLNRPGGQSLTDYEPNSSPRPSARSKAILTDLLGKICALQKAYGKTQAELETLVEGFSWALAGYPMDEVKRAFQSYIVSHPDIPAPADIIKLVKEARTYDGLTPPGIEQLREYKAKGIPLTPRQEEQLRQHEALA